MSIIDNRPPLVNIIWALNLTVAGVVAHQSALKDGEPPTVPLFPRDPAPLIETLFRPFQCLVGMTTGTRIGNAVAPRVIRCDEPENMCAHGQRRGLEMPARLGHVAVDACSAAAGGMCLTVFLVGTDLRTVTIALHAQRIAKRRGRCSIELVWIVAVVAGDAMFVHHRMNEFIALHPVLFANTVRIEFLGLVARFKGGLQLVMDQRPARFEARRVVPHVGEPFLDRHRLHALVAVSHVTLQTHLRRSMRVMVRRFVNAVFALVQRMDAAGPVAAFTTDPRFNALLAAHEPNEVAPIACSRCENLLVVMHETVAVPILVGRVRLPALQLRVPLAVADNVILSPLVVGPRHVPLFEFAADGVHNIATREIRILGQGGKIAQHDLCMALDRWIILPCRDEAQAAYSSSWHVTKPWCVRARLLLLSSGFALAYA